MEKDRIQDCNKKMQIYFEKGIFGFEDTRHYVLRRPEETDGILFFMENAEDPMLSFLMLDLKRLVPDYAPEVAEGELDALGGTGETSYAWYGICVAKRPIQKSTVNLRCPVVVNMATGKAKQIILENQNYGFRTTIDNFLNEVE